MVNQQRWRPASCDCDLEYVFATMTLIKAWKKCNLHKLLSGNALLNAVMTHNTTIGKRHTGEDMNNAILRKAFEKELRDEKMRIRSLG